MKNLSKSLICSMAVLLLMIFGCQKEDVETSTIDSTPSISYKIVSLDELPQLKPVLENIKKFRNENSELARGETYLGIDSVLVDNVIQITIDGVSTYSFGIDTDFYNTKYIENLHLHEKDSDYLGYVIRYTTPTGWEVDSTNYTPEGYLFLDPSNFEGHVTKYALDGQIIWTSDPNLLGRGNWGERCSYKIIKLCSNNGLGGQGATHVAGPGCTGYPKGQYTYTTDVVCETVDFFDFSITDGTYGGGGGGTPECVYLLGSTVDGTTVSPGYGNVCVENPNTTPVLLFEEWQEIVDCINGFDPIGSTDETTLSPIMINWLNSEATSEIISSVNNFLQANGCDESNQTFVLDLLDAIMADETIDEDALKFALEAQAQDKVFNPFDYSFLNSVNQYMDIDASVPDNTDPIYTHYVIKVSILKSLNPEWSYAKVLWEATKDVVHISLDIFGMIPVVGEIADLANGALYLIEGDGVNATLSFAATIPIAGWAATGAKYAIKIVDASQTASTIVGKVKLIWKVGADGNIIWGSNNYCRKQLRKVLGITDSAIHAHHIIPLAFKEHDLVQKAAKSENAFHINELLNGVPLPSSNHLTGHQAYIDKITDIFNEINSPSMSNNTAFDHLYDLTAQIKNLIGANPNMNLGQIADLINYP